MLDARKLHQEAQWTLWIPWRRTTNRLLTCLFPSSALSVHIPAPLFPNQLTDCCFESLLSSLWNQTVLPASPYLFPAILWIQCFLLFGLFIRHMYLHLSNKPSCCLTVVACIWVNYPSAWQLLKCIFSGVSWSVCTARVIIWRSWALINHDSVKALVNYLYDLIPGQIFVITWSDALFYSWIEPNQ